jgi:hypothetical protein
LHVHSGPLARHKRFYFSRPSCSSIYKHCHNLQWPEVMVRVGEESFVSLPIYIPPIIRCW